MKRGNKQIIHDWKNYVELVPEKPTNYLIEIEPKNKTKEMNPDTIQLSIVCYSFRNRFAARKLRFPQEDFLMNHEQRNATKSERTTEIFHLFF